MAVQLRNRVRCRQRFGATLRRTAVGRGARTSRRIAIARFWRCRNDSKAKPNRVTCSINLFARNTRQQTTVIGTVGGQGARMGGIRKLVRRQGRNTTLAKPAISLALAILVAIATSAHAAPAYKGMSYTSFGSDVLSSSASDQ